MTDLILKNNIQTIKTAVSAGIALKEAIINLERQLVANGVTSEEAKLRSKQAGDEVQKLQDEVYHDKDPRIAIRPKTENEKWYFGPNETDYLWPRYKKVLAKKLSEKTISDLDIATTRIVSQLGSPGASRFRKQGLVVGRVQSGKTSNFMGVLAKAGDAGYRIIIVLAGTTNTLRYQTQSRLQKDLINFRDTRWEWLTQAKCDPETLVVDPNGEFNQKDNATSKMGNPNVRCIAVIKKNAIILKRVRRWLQGVADQHKALCPVLIVDDECDNASVNSRAPGEDPTAINSEIRDILELLPKASYIGYTATPFANVLINPKAEDQDLYPRDFLFALPLNPEYFGPERVFGREAEGDNDPGSEGNDIVRTISEEDATMVCPSTRAAAQQFTMQAPPSLVEAIRYYLLNSAARTAREKQLGVTCDFKSMLINTAPWIKIHRITKPQVEKTLKDLESEFKNNPVIWKNHWESESQKFTQKQIGCQHAKVSWDELYSFLTTEFFSEIKVIVSNSNPNEASNLNAEYDESNKGKKLIVIGGNTLSRGITIEGLTVSYFVRKSSAYDTLLQMGRWFGYRKDYEDMPRVWMTAEMEDQFLQLSGVEQDMFNELESFMNGKSPAEVGLRIRQCPGMQITARAKMYYARQCSIDYTGFMENSTFLHRKDKAALEANKQAVEALIKASGGPQSFSPRSQYFLARNIDCDAILTFLSSYSLHPKNQKLDTSIVQKYIKGQNNKKRCLKWNIAIKTRNDDDGSGYTLGGLRINRLQLPRSFKYPNDSFAYVQNLSTREDHFADAPDPAKVEQAAEHKSRQTLRLTFENGVGLVVLYPINKDSRKGESKTRLDMEAESDPIGIAIYFPGDPNPNGKGGYVDVAFDPPTAITEEDEETPATTL
jgi:hypothetical protein